MTSRRKALGRRGEALLDLAFARWGWSREAANRRVRHGEIDRLYKFQGKAGLTWCVVEAKTLRVPRGVSVARYLGGDFLRAALRPRQCRTLHEAGRRLAAWGARVHVRVFRVFVFASVEERMRGELYLRGRFARPTVPGAAQRTPAVRVNALSDTAVALSFAPEFVPAGQGSSPLQIDLR